MAPSHSKVDLAILAQGKTDRQDSVVRALFANSGYQTHSAISAMAHGIYGKALASEPVGSLVSGSVPISARDRAFATPEILVSILTKLESAPLRNAMFAGKLFYNAIAPETASREMREALGLEHSKKFPDMADLKALGFKVPLEVDHKHRSQFLNVNLIESMPPRHGPVPILDIKPFVAVRLAYDSEGASATLKLTLMGSGVPLLNNMVHEKGVLRNHFDGMGVVRYANTDCESWANIKILKDAVPLRVAVKVDYRQEMLQPKHPDGICNIPFCQIGRYGVQRTSKLFTPKNATLGKLVDFLNDLEVEVVRTVRELETAARIHYALRRTEELWVGQNAGTPPVLPVTWH